MVAATSYWSGAGAPGSWESVPRAAPAKVKKRPLTALALPGAVPCQERRKAPVGLPATAGVSSKQLVQLVALKEGATGTVAAPAATAIPRPASTPPTMVPALNIDASF